MKEAGLFILMVLFLILTAFIRMPILLVLCFKKLFSKEQNNHKILFLTVGQDKKGLAPSSRFRVYQYLPYLKKAGFYCRIRPSRPYKYFTANFSFRKINKNYPKLGKLLKETGLLLMKVNRIWDIIESKFFDIVFLQKDLSPGVSPRLEGMLHSINPNIIFDFDDAIYLHPSWLKNANSGSLKNPGMEAKIAKIISLSDYIVVANEYLQNFALQFNNRVSVINTPIDVNRFIPAQKSIKSLVVIGWTGTSVNLYYLKPLMPVFRELLNVNTIIKVISNRVLDEDIEELKMPNLEFQEWRFDMELRQLQSFDIGIMPLEDDEWSRGKAAFKLIEYMAVGIPVVCSAVGFNLEVVKDGVNGFFANTPEEWYEKLSMLIKDGNLREEMGSNARNFVEKRYSIETHYPKLVNVFSEIINNKG